MHFRIVLTDLCHKKNYQKQRTYNCKGGPGVNRSRKLFATGEA